MAKSLNPGKIKGIRKLQEKLLKLGDAAGGTALREANKSAMTPVLKQAIVNVPVGRYQHFTYKGNPAFPGYLKRSIVRRNRLSKDKQQATTVIGVKDEAYYGLQFVELGTSKMPKQPWLEPAMTSQIETVERLLKEQLKKQIDKAARKK